MIRVSIREQIQNFIVLLLIQLPLVHRIVLFDKAFAFFYIGFLLMLPATLSRTYLMLIAFGSGLLVDVFSNTPGIHAGVSVFIMFVRNFWLRGVNDDYLQLVNINMETLKKSGFLYFIFPLVLIHHFLIFTIENGGFQYLGMLMTKVVFSTAFTCTVIFVINFVFTPKSRRK